MAHNVHNASCTDSVYNAITCALTMSYYRHWLKPQCRGVKRVCSQETMVQVSGTRCTMCVSEFRMAAEPRLTMRKCARPATDDRETVEEYTEVRQIDNEFEIVEMREIDNENSEIDEFKETREYSEYKQQTL
eukprot:3897724-Amphidinium_carterae.1